MNSQEVGFVEIAGILREAFGRIGGSVHAVLDDISLEHLTFRPGDRANSVDWLIWHLTRIQDDHVAAVAGTEQVWTAEGWAERFDLPFGVQATGYGQNAEEVGAVKAGPELLRGYYDAVHQQTLAFVGHLEDGDLDRVVDDSWDPPVTLGVRLVSVIEDDLKHLGQAAYVLGLCG